MPAAVRENDTCTCGGAYPNCSPNVFINGRSSIALLCTGCDMWCRPLNGSSNVFVNFTAKHRVGDSADELLGTCCIGVAATGSPNVFVNG